MTKHKFNTHHAEILLSKLNIETAWIRVDPDSEYHKTYNAIVNFAECVVDDCKNGSEKVLACATYGWMPTIMKKFCLKKTGLDHPIRQIKEVRKDDEALNLLEKMSSESLVKNSWIGASKFMHFLNPSIFPIWDTRVAEKFSEHCISFTFKDDSDRKTLKIPSAYSFANNKENYQKYTAFMLEQRQKKHEWLQPLSDRFSDEKSYRPTDIRLLEIMLFHQKHTLSKA